MRAGSLRGHKAASAAAAARCVDEVVVGGTHVALLLHGRTSLAVVDRVAGATAAELLAADQVRLDQAGQMAQQAELAGKAGFLVRSFAPQRVASVAWEAGVGTLRLSAVLREGAVEWWDWDSSKCWSGGESKKLVSANGSRDEIECAKQDPTVVGSWLCLESNAATSELALWRRGVSGSAVLIARVPGDGASARLFVSSKDSVAWILSNYGGLCCVNLADPKPFCPPSFHKDTLIEQHPVTRELALLSRADGKVYLLRPFVPPHLLCTLSLSLSGVVGFGFLSQTVCVLDENGARCTAFDLGTGTVLRTHATPPGMQMARCGIAGPILVLWGGSVGFQLVQHDAVSATQAQLPADRGAKMALDWGLKRLAAWRLLADGKDPAAVAAFTATPALSVAMAGGAEDAALVEMIRKHLANDAPRHQFETLSLLTAQVDPLLEKWADAKLPVLEYPAMSEQEQLEVRALDEPEAVLEELLAAPRSDDVWRFCLACRLLFRLRPTDLVAFVLGESDEGRGKRLQLAADCMAVAGPQKLCFEQVIAASRILQDAGNAAASARLLLANGIPQRIDFRLAFAEALRRGDEATLAQLWADCDLDDETLFRLLHVYGEDQQPLTVGLLRKIMAARK